LSYVDGKRGEDRPMSWKPSSDAMIALFERLLPKDPRVERKTMFGCPMGYANGNVFFGLHEDRFILRVGDDDRAVLLKEFKAKPFEPMPGRKSSQTLVLPEKIAGDPKALRTWCEKALAHALSLPTKKAKKKAAARKSAGATVRAPPRSRARKS
jgi:TfoX/Sxy family transcriptional regulator of competence genes